MINHSKMYSTKELAELLEVSRPTIDRAAKALNIEADEVGHKGAKYYSFDNASKIIKEAKPNFDFANFQKPTEETLTDLNENQQTSTDNSTDLNENENLSQQTSTTQQTSTKTSTDLNKEPLLLVIDTLREQLAAKDKIIEALTVELEAKNKQIEVNNKQIEEYSNRLKEALELTKGQLIDKMTDKPALKLEEPKVIKQRWIDKLFKRNK